MRFGYLPSIKSPSGRSFRISILPDVQTYEHLSTTWPGVKDGWIYPPMEADPRFGISVPLRQSPVLGLQPSHEIVLTEASPHEDRDLRYLILCYGFLSGLHLLPEGWIHFQRTAIQPGKLVGFVIPGNQESDMLEIMLERYRVLSLDLQRRLYGLVHWFLMSQEYIALHDRFFAQYIVADAAYGLARSIGLIGAGIRHSQRIESLCDAFEIETPDWAHRESTGNSYVSRIRNDLFHDAIFAGEPIGFSHPDRNVTFGLECLNEFFVICLTGLGRSVASFPTGISRMTYPLELHRNPE